jgi:hypothetical protein
MSTMNTLIADLEAIPLADMTKRDQLTFAAAIGHLRRLSDRVHTLEISQHRTAEKIEELERENAALRGALEPFVSQHAKWSERLPDTQRFAVMCLSSPADGDIVMDADITMADFRRAALAGSGE